MEVIYVGMEDPGDLAALDELRFRTGLKVRPVIVAPTELWETLDRSYRRLVEAPDGCRRVGELDVHRRQQHHPVDALKERCVSCPQRRAGRHSKGDRASDGVADQCDARLRAIEEVRVQSLKNALGHRVGRVPARPHARRGRAIAHPASQEIDQDQVVVIAQGADDVPPGLPIGRATVDENDHTLLGQVSCFLDRDVQRLGADERRDPGRPPGMGRRRHAQLDELVDVVLRDQLAVG